MEIIKNNVRKFITQQNNTIAHIIMKIIENKVNEK